MRRKIKKRHNYTKLVLKITALLSIISLTFWLYQHLFIVKDINCHILPDKNCEPAVEVELRNLIGNTLITLKTDALEEKIKGAYPSIISINFTPKLPGLIDVAIQKTKPIAKISQSSSSAVLLIQDNGYLTTLDPEVAQSLPAIYYQDLKYNDQSVKIEDKSLNLLINLIKKLNEYFIQIDQITTASDLSAHVKLTHGPVAIFDLNTDLKRQIESLQLIISNTSSELPVKTIDLRLTKPTITTRETD